MQLYSAEIPQNSFTQELLYTNIKFARMLTTEGDFADLEQEPYLYMSVHKVPRGNFETVVG